MRKWLNNNFGFTKKEYNGLIALVFIISILQVAPYVYNGLKINPSNNPETQTAIQKLSIVNQENIRNNVGYYIEEKENKITKKLFVFDPNTIDLEHWQALGLSLKQAQSILNYRNKGGKFYKAEDLQKMYAISPQMYNRLLPYIDIEHAAYLNTYTKQFDKEEVVKYEKKALPIIEINTADSTKLEEIKGIGAAFAKRILKYRERLGGFYKKEQLLEVYGIDTLKYNEIQNQITVNPLVVKKININNAIVTDFKGHPYLTYKQVNAILQYKKQHGNYNSIADFKNILILTPQNIERIAPYIVF